MSTHFTPGPWKLDDRGWDGQFIYGTDERVPGTGLRLIAEVDLNYDGAEANARLIAASPDLLDALQGFIDGAEAMGWNTDKARAAIAKALGEKK